MRASPWPSGGPPRSRSPSRTTCAPSPSPVPPEASLTASAVQRCVLVADDDPLVRGLWTDALREAGYRVVEAADGLEAVNAMRFLLPDLVVLDLRMPHLSGQDVLALARGS